MKKKFGDITIRELANMELVDCDYCPLTYYDDEGEIQRLCDLLDCLPNLNNTGRLLLEREVDIKPLKEA